VRRGTTEGAACADCPFSLDGQPARPVLAEIPDDPRWILVGEGPGRTETYTNRQFCGALQLVDKMLAKVGRRRDELVLTTAYLCQATEGADEAQRHRAAAACKGRLAQELAEFPQMPVLSLGAVAAKALIPQAVIEAIDPPTVSKAKKRSQKERQRAEAKALAKALRAEEQATAAHAKARKLQATQIAGLASQRLKWLVERERTQIRARLMRPLPGEPFRKRKAPRAHVLDEYLALTRKGLEASAQAWAVQQWKVTQRVRLANDAHATANPLPPKPRKAAKVKPKTFKLANVLSTCLEVDADGTGVLRPLVPSIHPATLTSGGGASIRGAHTPDLGFINLYYDAGKVDGLSRGQDLWLKLDVAIEFSDPDRAAQLLVDLLDEAVAEGEVALDLETYVDDPERHHALMAYVARIRTLGLATQGRAISVWWDLLPGWALSRLQAVLGSERVTKVYHNGLYDRTVLMGNGYTLAGPWEDTLLAHHAGFPGCAHNLQTVTAQFFAVAPWKSTYKNAEESPERLTRYNAQDTAATRALRPALTLRVQRTRTEQVYALDKRMSEIATKMHLVGMPVSREVNAELRRVFLANIRQAKQVVEAAAADPAIQEEIRHQLALEEARTQRRGDPDTHRERYALRLAALTQLVDAKTWRWKITAGKHIAALLQASGADLTATSSGGALSTKKDVLEQLTHVKVVRDILAYRENEKLYATFVGPIFDQDRDGDVVYGYADERQRIHPIWSVHKITGRWGSAEPVVSNVPKDKWKALAEPAGLVWTPEGAGFVATDAHGIPWRKDAKGKIVKRTRPNLRAQVVAPPGRIFVGFDFSQLEARIIALISGDPFLCQVFADGLDIHRECARVVFPSFDTMGKDEQKMARDQTKPLEYGAFYGGSVETLWRTIVKERPQAKLADIAAAVGSLMGKMSGVVAWQRLTVARASQPPYEIREFLYGRTRTFPLGQVEPTEAMNFGVQAAAASIMNTGMERMDRALDGYKQAYAIAQIHDAAVFECWEDDAEALQADVIRCFTQAYERDGRMVPFPVEAAIGKSWAEV